MIFYAKKERFTRSEAIYKGIMFLNMNEGR